jgi:membrane protein required for colicin V production
MHWLDFTLVLVFLIGGLFGLRSGLLWQVARFAIFFGAVYACIQYNTVVADELLNHFEGLNDSTSKLMAHIVIFLGVCLIGVIVTLILEHFLRAVNLKPVDRLLGGVVGVLKMALLAGGLLTGIALYGTKETNESIAGSKIAPPLLDGMQYVLAAVPEKVKDDLGKALEEIRKEGAQTLHQSGKR